ncbi:hypothetical protein PHET_00974 [Paragonimus heterotremus]|uniref:G protein-coupled receptor n=1 Tax=Paragonimus heterotremus TaxID=100268 RepID=A0A8J4TS70_9TREM|nr:hypothetical protein PHET_00974 [Paragonimus heterotremus]
MVDNNGTISVYERYNGSDLLLYQRFVPHLNIIERVNYPIWATIGLPGGLFSIYLWSSRPMRRGGSAAAAIYQACVGVVDVSFFIVYLFWYLHVAWMIPVLDNPGVCEIFPLFNYAIQYLSPMLTVVFTVERVLHDTTNKKQNTLQHLITNGPTLPNMEQLTQMQTLRATSMHQGDTYNRNVRSSTITLLCTSSYVVVAHLSVAIGVLIHNLLPAGNEYLTDEQIEQDPQWRTFFIFITVRTLIDSFSMTHYAVKFPIYLATSRQFRHEFSQLFGFTDCGGCIKCEKKQHLLTGDLIRQSSSASGVNPSVCQLRPTKHSTHLLMTEERDAAHLVGLPKEARRKQVYRAKDTLAPVQPRRRPSPGLTRSVIGVNGTRVPVTAKAYPGKNG